MNKPTDEETRNVWHAAYGDAAELYGIDGLQYGTVHGAARRALHDAGIAHGFREAIEALRTRIMTDSGSSKPSYLVLDLERIAKERGYV